MRRQLLTSYSLPYVDHLCPTVKTSPLRSQAHRASRLTMAWTLLIIALGISNLALPGCRTDLRPGPSQPTAVIREFRSDPVRLNLEIDRAVVGEVSMIVTKVTDSQSGAVVSGADVRIRVQTVSTPPSGPPERIQPSQDREVEEVPQKGLYRTTHRFENSGKYDLTVMVRKPGEQTAIAFTTTVEVTDPSEKSTDFTRLAKIGGLVMAACMVIMMGVMGALLLL